MRKVVLGMVHAATENSAVCREFLSELIERGLRYEEGLLYVVDGIALVVNERKTRCPVIKALITYLEQRKNYRMLKDITRTSRKRKYFCFLTQSLQDTKIYGISPLIILDIPSIIKASPKFSRYPSLCLSNASKLKPVSCELY